MFTIVTFPAIHLGDKGMKKTILFAMACALVAPAWSATDSPAMPADYQKVLGA
jgi:hypothetical protein